MVKRFFVFLLVCLVVMAVFPFSVYAVTGNGFSIDTTDNTLSNEYWLTLDIFSIFNSVSPSDEDFLLISTNVPNNEYYGLSFYYKSSSGIYVIVPTKISSISPYSSLSFPLGSIVSDFNSTLSKWSSDFVFRNFSEALAYWKDYGCDSYFLVAESYIRVPSNESYAGSVWLENVGHISSAGTVSYNHSILLWSGSNSTYHRGLFVDVVYPVPDVLWLLPSNYTVSYGIDESVCYRLNRTDGSTFHSSTLFWSCSVLDPAGNAVAVDWCSIDPSTGILSLTADSIAGYDVTVSASWGTEGQMYTKSTTLRIRDLNIDAGDQTDIGDVSDQIDGISDQLDDVSQQVEQLPGQITDGFAGVLEDEKQQAQVEGDNAATDVIDIIPDYSANFTNAYDALITILNYEGTDAVLITPAITVPGIDGLYSEFTVMQPQKIDFEEWFNRMPSAIMSIIRALFDVAIVGYCIKEFLSMVGGFANGYKNTVEE